MNIKQRFVCHAKSYFYPSFSLQLLSNVWARGLVVRGFFFYAVRFKIKSAKKIFVPFSMSLYSRSLVGCFCISHSIIAFSICCLCISILQMLISLFVSMFIYSTVTYCHTAFKASRCGRFVFFAIGSWWIKRA